jgi:hypothetical protein
MEMLVRFGRAFQPARIRQARMSARFTGSGLIAAALVLLLRTNKASLLLVVFPVSILFALALVRSAPRKRADGETEKR